MQNKQNPEKIKEKKDEPMCDIGDFGITERDVCFEWQWVTVNLWAKE